MIRRLFWMTVGAVAGVTGYRRITRLARALQPPARGRDGAGRRGGLASFLGDVRDGMELYMHRRSAPPGPALEAQHVLADGRGQPAGSRAYPGPDYAKDGR